MIFYMSVFQYITCMQREREDPFRPSSSYISQNMNFKEHASYPQFFPSQLLFPSVLVFRSQTTTIVLVGRKFNVSPFMIWIINLLDDPEFYPA